MADAAPAAEEEEVDEPYATEPKPLSPSNNLFLSPEATP
jgi:hypothetical protein